MEMNTNFFWGGGWIGMQREKDIIFKVPKIEEEGQMPILRKGTENFNYFFLMVFYLLD